MTSFEDRQKGFESKYAHDEEIAFKINARRNKLLGLWAAGKLGKSGADAETYAGDVVVADFDTAGDGDVLEKLLRDFEQAGIGVTAHEIRAEMERLLAVARAAVTGAAG